MTHTLPHKYNIFIVRTCSLSKCDVSSFYITATQIVICPYFFHSVVCCCLYLANTNKLLLWATIIHQKWIEYLRLLCIWFWTYMLSIVLNLRRHWLHIDLIWNDLTSGTQQGQSNIWLMVLRALSQIPWAVHRKT